MPGCRAFGGRCDASRSFTPKCENRRFKLPQNVQKPLSGHQARMASEIRLSTLVQTIIWAMASVRTP